MLWDPARFILNAKWRHVAVVVLLSISTCVYAQEDGSHIADTTSTVSRDNAELGAAETQASRATIRKIIEREAAKAGLPADIAEAVVFVESGYNPAVIGSAGQVGLMQVRPEAAATLGFRGNNTELAEPDINIHYGVLYLGRAWQSAGGDLCRALTTYREGQGTESVTPGSQVHCNRARNRILAVTSATAASGASAVAEPVQAPPALATRAARAPKVPAQPTGAYSRYRQGTAAASRAYWAAHEARINLIRARIKAKWKRVAPLG